MKLTFSAYLLGPARLEVAHRADAGVEVEVLAESHVDGAEARRDAVVLRALVARAGVILLVGAVETHVRLLADGGRERSLDRDAQVPDRLDRLVGEFVP